MAETNLLIDCLDELERYAWDVEALLVARPDLPTTVVASIRAAARVRLAPRPVPSEAFRGRARAGFATAVNASATASRTPLERLTNRLGPWLRPIATPIAVALLLAFVIGGVRTASASALPGTPLYPAKIAVEQAQLFVAYSPELQAQAHLQIASARLKEAAAETRDADPLLITALLQSYEQQLQAAQVAAAHSKSTAYHQEVSRRVESLQTEQEEVLPKATRPADRPAKPKTTEPTPVPKTPVPSNGAPDVARSNPGDGEKEHLDKRGEKAAPANQPDGGASPTATAAAPPPVAQPAPAPAVDPSEQLVKRLIAQALAGDVNGASAADHAYVAFIQTARPGDDASINRLKGHRAQLQHALSQAPPSTRPYLTDALRAVATALATAPGGDGSASGGDNGNAANASNAPTDDHANGNASHGGSDNHQTGSDDSKGR